MKQQDPRVVWAEIVVGAFFFAMILKAFMISGYVVPSNSMENTLMGGDFILAGKLAYLTKTPKPGDLVVFKYPHNPRKTFIKRCIASSGQTVEIRDKTLFVDDWIVPPPEWATFKDSEILSLLVSNRDNFGPFVVPPGHIFVMGDNRDYSSDSRAWGAVPLSMVKAKPRIVYFAWKDDPYAPDGDGFAGKAELFFYNLTHVFSRLNLSRVGHIPE